jgi:threonine dehydratase
LNSPISRLNIEEAHQLIAGYIHRTPVLSSTSLNSLCGCNLFFKCENFQKGGAFKSRGASNALFHYLEDAHKHGVATHSSGNHAQALARVAAYAGVKAYIVMPENSNPLKVAAVKEYGGIITFCKPTLQSREDTLKEIIQQTGAIEIHPYDNEHIISGQATAAKELLEEIPSPHIIIAPVGGGGLLSGTALACHYFSSGTKVFAAEPLQANDAWQSFKSKKFIPSVNPDTIADGLRTSLGSLTFPIILEHVDEILTVSEQGIINAMKTIWLRMKVIVEPSAAVVLAAIIEHPEFFKGKTVGAILSGGNADINNLPWNDQ